MPDELDDVAFLTRAPKRLDILRSLQRRPKDLRDLSDDLGAPRTTLNDNLTALEEREWVERTDGTYRATTLGRCVESTLRDCRESLVTANELAPFLRFVPADGIDVDLASLDGSDVVTASFPRPYEPVARFVDAIREASRLRASGPMVAPVFDAVHESVVEADLDAELLTSRDRYRALRGEFESMVESGLATGRLRFGIRGSTERVGVALADGRLLLGGIDDDGLIRTLVENDSDDAVAWGESLLGEHRDAVTEFVQ